MKAIKSLLVFVFLLVVGNCKAQYTDRYWCFGDSAGIDFKNLTNPVAANSVLRVRGTCASICDSSGNLLFYCGTPNWQQWTTPNSIFTDGYVLNKMHQKMFNGDSLATTGWYQEMVIVPMPDNDSLFYVFCAGVVDPVVGLYYSIVNVKYNNGQGKVIQKNVQLRTDSICDGITAVKHGNGRDWWVIVRKWTDTPINEITAYLISPAGVTAYPSQNIGTPRALDGFYRLKFSLNGEHLYNVSVLGIIERMDFDRCNGLFSNLNIYAGLNSPYINYWGFEVSPDESKLYTTLIYQGVNQDHGYILQFDLNATNFLASVDTIGSYILPDLPGVLEIGPNKKIYASIFWAGPDNCYDYLYCYSTTNTTNSNLSVINYPDSSGASCDYQPFSFNLGGHKVYTGLPNNPNYEQTAWIGSPCDTLTALAPNIFPKQRQLNLYYDPSWQTVFVNAAELKGKRGVLEFYNSNGQLLSTSTQTIDGGYFMQSSSFASQPSGVYVVRLQTEKEVLTGKFVKR